MNQLAYTQIPSTNNKPIECVSSHNITSLFILFIRRNQFITAKYCEMSDFRPEYMNLVRNDHNSLTFNFWPCTNLQPAGDQLVRHNQFQPYAHSGLAGTIGKQDSREPHYWVQAHANHRESKTNNSAQIIQWTQQYCSWNISKSINKRCIIFPRSMCTWISWLLIFI